MRGNRSLQKSPEWRLRQVSNNKTRPGHNCSNLQRQKVRASNFGVDTDVAKTRRAGHAATRYAEENR